MNEDSSTAYTDMPENFNPHDFKEKIAYLCQTIANIMEGQYSEVLNDFFPKVLDALVTHEGFNQWPNDLRLRVISHWRDLEYLVQNMSKVFTDDISYSQHAIQDFINALVIPAPQIQQQPSI